MGNGWIKTQKLKNMPVLGTSTLVPSGLMKQNTKVRDNITELSVKERPDPERSHMLY